MQLSVYKRIHIVAIATFYLIALSLRLIILAVGHKYPTLEGNYAFQLSTGWSIYCYGHFQTPNSLHHHGQVYLEICCNHSGAMPCVWHYRRIGHGSIMLVGIHLWLVGRIRMARIFAIRVQTSPHVAIRSDHYNHVVSVAFGLASAQPTAILFTSAFRFMGNW